MAGLDFPDTPAVGAVHGSGAASWRWDGARWASTGGAYGGARGVVGYAKITATQGNIDPWTNISGLSVSFTASPSRTYRTSLVSLVTSTVGGDKIVVGIRDGVGTELQQGWTAVATAGWLGSITISAVETGLSGVQTRLAACARGAGTGAISFFAAAGAPAYILVEDITYEAGMSAGGGGGGGGGGSDGFSFVQETTPVATAIGQTWFKTSTGATYTWYDSFWVQTSPGGAGGVGFSFVQTTAPVGTTVGQTWYNPLDTRTNVWTGAEWIPYGAHAAFRAATTGALTITSATTVYIPFVDSVGTALGDVGNPVAGRFTLGIKGVYEIMLRADMASSWGGYPYLTADLCVRVGTGGTDGSLGTQTFGPSAWASSQCTWQIDNLGNSNLQYGLRFWNYGATIGLSSSYVTMTKIGQRS